jgi:hypothetical protein
MRTRIKACCPASIDEAPAAIETGAEALGLAAAMPSGPGVDVGPLAGDYATMRFFDTIELAPGSAPLQHGTDSPPARLRQGWPDRQNSPAARGSPAKRCK